MPTESYSQWQTLLSYCIQTVLPWYITKLSIAISSSHLHHKTVFDKISADFVGQMPPLFPHCVKHTGPGDETLLFAFFLLAKLSQIYQHLRDTVLTGTYINCPMVFVGHIPSPQNESTQSHPRHGAPTRKISQPAQGSQSYTPQWPVWLSSRY